ncbi:MAG: AGE family epimerase/isomerase [Candidatus Latescibacterota bacterium]|jgi:mannose/cellobiose epimerase-like protein (N-acyl-D-glucosamine 2-epimerase family)
MERKQRSTGWLVVGAILAWGALAGARGQVGSAPRALPDDQRVMRPDTWRDQALGQVMPPWLEHGRDRVHGGFYTGLARDWQRVGGTEKYPTMLGRHLYSLSAAFLLSGEEEYLRLARDTAAWLVDHGWDHRYGGWYRSVTETGEPADTTKDAFTQMYANTGLALYYLATRDATARRCLERSNEILQTNAWDSVHGGYYVTLNRDLSVQSTNKSFNPQIGILSSYLLYLYLADGRPEYLAQMQRDIDLALRRMQTPEEGYILDDFDRTWTYQPRYRDGVEMIGVGGNIETSWVLMRLYHLTGNQAYRTKALDLADRMIRIGWDPVYGGWYPGFARSDPGQVDPQKVWFIQAYGNFMTLGLYNLTQDPQYLDYFRRTAVFWTEHLLDPEYGGDYVSTDRAGNLLDGTKGTSSKGSYHTMEHALLNYLYLSLYVQREPAVLYFHVAADRAPGDLRVCPVEDPAVEIDQVQVNGQPWGRFDARRRTVELPPGECAVRVVLMRQP